MVNYKVRRTGKEKGKKKKEKGKNDEALRADN